MSAMLHETFNGLLLIILVCTAQGLVIGTYLSTTNYRIHCIVLIYEILTFASYSSFLV